MAAATLADQLLKECEDYLDIVRDRDKLAASMERTVTYCDNIVREAEAELERLLHCRAVC